jgi:hypothetical protein
MKKPFHPKYPKLLLLILSIILAYILIKNPVVYNFLSNLNTLSYLGVFIAGMLFAFGFTAAFALGFFIALQPSNILIAGIIGGLGALVSDLLIFNFIKLSFANEFAQLQKTKSFKLFDKNSKKFLGKKIKNYLMLTFAGFLIASPLPDEVGVTLLSGLTKIKQSAIAIIGFVLNTIGILIILYLSI